MNGQDSEPPTPGMLRRRERRSFEVRFVVAVWGVTAGVIATLLAWDRGLIGLRAMAGVCLVLCVALALTREALVEA